MNEKVFEYIIEGRIQSGFEIYGDFVEIPFKVLENVDLILLEFTYDADCKLGLGLIDSTNALRGWSAERKSKVYISKASASFGYVPGEVVPGVWRAIVRLDKVSKNGCGYRLRVTGYRTLLAYAKFNNINEFLLNLSKSVDIAKFVKEFAELVSITNYIYPCTNYSPKSCRSSARSMKVRDWIKGDLHIHTVHSDGRNTVCEVLDLARSRGLDFIALTDHNTISQNIEFNEIKEEYGDIIVVPGIEITTPYGHVNVFNVNKYVDFRRRGIEDFKKLIDEAHSMNCIISINHPDIFREPVCMDCPFRYRNLRGFDAVEVWNGPWQTLNSESLQWWHSLLMEGHRVTAIGGSDYHGVETSIPRIGEPTTWVFVEKPTLEEILNGIKSGRVYITYKPSEPIINLRIVDGDGSIYGIGDEISTKRYGDLELFVQIFGAKNSHLRVITENGVCRAIPIDSNSFIYREKLIECGNTKFVRIEVGMYNDVQRSIPMYFDNLLALTNPIYVRQL